MLHAGRDSLLVSMDVNVIDCDLQLPLTMVSIQRLDECRVGARRLVCLVQFLAPSHEGLGIMARRSHSIAVLWAASNCAAIMPYNSSLGAMPISTPSMVLAFRSTLAAPSVNQGEVLA